MWKTSCIDVVDANLTLSFTEIKKFALEELKCVGLLDLFLHHLGFMVFKFDFPRSLYEAIVISTLFVKCVEPAFEVFLNHEMRTCS